MQAGQFDLPAALPPCCGVWEQSASKAVAANHHGSHRLPSLPAVSRREGCGCCARPAVGSYLTCDPNSRKGIDTLHSILRMTFSGDRQCKIRLQAIARIWRDQHQSPDSPPPPSSARNTSSPGLRHKDPWPTAPSSHQRETTFSNTAGSCPESSTRRSICASTVTSADTARAARNFSSTSGAAPAAVAEQHCNSTANQGFSRTLKSRHRSPPIG